MAQNSPPRRRYLDNAELQALVREHRRTQVVSHDLALAFRELAARHWHWCLSLERDDFISEIVLYLIQAPLANADPSQNLFAYFTTCTIRRARSLQRRASIRRRQFAEFVEDGLACGREFPRVEYLAAS